MEKVHNALGNSVANIDVTKLIAKPGQRELTKEIKHYNYVIENQS
jgi:hypothetical protein